VICVCGLPGCGKSTASKRLAEKYGLKYVSGGDALKSLAEELGYSSGRKGWWETDDGMRFLKERTKNSEFDRRVDEKLVELANEGDVVIDSWTMPWLLSDGFKVWLDASPERRAERIAERDGIGIKDAMERLKMREEKTKSIYKKLYGFDLGEDFEPFQLIIDTNDLSTKEVFRVLRMAVDHLVVERS
jgi:cytidylate kinase